MLKSVSGFHKNKHRKDGYTVWCKECNSVYATARWRADPEKGRIKNRKYFEKHPEIARNTNLKRKFGITLEDYNRMWNDQNGLCAVCGKPETATRKNVTKCLAVDHNHKTEKVRALLCQQCNYALGFADDNIERLIDLAEYLERHD